MGELKKQEKVKLTKWLSKIKQKYGEKMFHFCRTEFSCLLETDAEQKSFFELLENNFAFNGSLVEDVRENGAVTDLKQFIFTKAKEKNVFNYFNKVNCQDLNLRTPEELLAEAGYLIEECKTEADVQKYRKYYYRPLGQPLAKYSRAEKPKHHVGEELCSFAGDSLCENRVWFIRKKDEIFNCIKRENFKDPNKQDDYSTSLLCIKLPKDGCSGFKIISRYNHSVINPDNTFNSNLDNIVPGLTASFERYYGVNDNTSNAAKSELKMDNYVKANDGKYYPYNCVINKIYYCPNNIIINENGDVEKLNSDHIILADYFIFDTKNGTVSIYDQIYQKNPPSDDAFFDLITELDKQGQKQKLKIAINKNVIMVQTKNNGTFYIGIDKNNRIVSVKNEALKQCENSFFRYCEHVKEIDIPLLENCGDYFFGCNRYVKTVNLANLKYCGDGFMFCNYFANEINLSNLESCGDDFFFSNNTAQVIRLLNLKNCGDGFFYENNSINKAYLPVFERSGEGFMASNMCMKNMYFYAPNLKDYKEDFFRNNLNIKKEVVKDSIALKLTSMIRAFHQFSLKENLKTLYRQVQSIGKVV